MSTCNKALLCLGLLSLVPLGAQDTRLDVGSSVKIDLPSGSPVALVSTKLGESRATARGGAMVLDLHMSLALRNSGYRRIRGVSLMLLAQELTPAGWAYVAVPSLDVGPNETFPVRIDVRLMRPLQAGGPLVQISLDGVLFQDLSFYGPNKLNSQRSMTFWEMEAQRDRKYFKQVLQSRGAGALQQEMLDSLARQADLPQLDVQVTRRGRATSAAASSPDHVAQFAFLDMPGAPVEAVNGWAEVANNEVRAPRIEVLNRSSKAVRYVEIGWLVKDSQGHEYLAGSVPASEGELFLPPGQTGRLLQETSVRFSKPAPAGARNGMAQPVPIQGMTGFVSQVEYADGTVWIPRRESLENDRLRRVMAPSPEEQRLTDLYRTKGLGMLIEELKKF